MTLSTSAVAVCCCSDSRSSLSRRVFSMAMTAWEANVSSSWTCISLNKPASARPTVIAPDGAAFPQHWHCNKRAEAGAKSCILNFVVRVRADIRDLDDRALIDRARRASRVAWLHRESAAQGLDPC